MYPERKYLSVNASQLAYFQALSSKTRISIIELLQKDDLSIQDLSHQLGLSSAMITKHISILEKNGIVESKMAKGIHGQLKICMLKKNDVVLIFNPFKDGFIRNSVTKSLPIGGFYDFDVSAPCGLTTGDKIIGFVDDPNTFYYEKKDEIELMWFTSGYLAYHIPLFDIELKRLASIEVSLEVCAEYPGYKMHWPSKVDFELNGLPLGGTTLLGDFGDRKGLLTPSWWNLGTEYGRQIIINISDQGTSINGERVSATTLKDVLARSTEVLTFKLATTKEFAKGGLNIFGRKFGDYPQDINVRFAYNKSETAVEA
ncbi:ArsR family transcriptional regulator [Secundilactobacillus pentosiphilus]|uniref:ArsR family transcriptional regulator n=1 Tax=Secundilactobacillus pentosiphilus TaxID=1714682 RepID=A0A1Z5IY87_9LACO|nr:ArsR family transcriptional regulator [Secundilactobacillus pentosiphilus]GAX06743.1 ArsR family transcriptional regulator [Secundilactobacillus pentosiphilus]